jgi:hypothetical protein
MGHWQARAGNRIHTVRYEDLVRAKQTTLERATDFLGLDAWHGTQEQDISNGLIRTASAWQARQELHSRSISRWKSYYPMASQFFDSIAEIDQRFD